MRIAREQKEHFPGNNAPFKIEIRFKKEVISSRHFELQCSVGIKNNSNEVALRHQNRYF